MITLILAYNYYATTTIDFASRLCYNYYTTTTTDFTSRLYYYLMNLLSRRSYFLLVSLNYLMILFRES